MTDIEFLDASAALCAKLGKWPEWRVAAGQVTQQLVYNDSAWEAGNCWMKHEPSDYEVACILKDFWRNILKERHCEMSEGLDYCRVYQCSGAESTLIVNAPDTEAALIAAVETVLEKQGHD